MQPQQQTTEKLDPSVVNLTKAIGLTETGGKYMAVGDGGTSAGAYQWNNGKPLQRGEVPGKFKTYAEQVGADPSDFSPTNQDRVAYKKIESWGKAGFKPAQIASMWNAGEGEPLAYTGKFKDGRPSVIQGQYDVPGYTKKVAANYERLMQSVNASNGTPAPQPAPAPAPQDLGGQTHSVAQSISDFTGKAGDFLGGMAKKAIQAPVTLATRAGELAGVGIAHALPQYFDPAKADMAANKPMQVPGLGVDVKPIGDENLETLGGEGLSTISLGIPSAPIAGALGAGGVAMQEKGSPLKVAGYTAAGGLLGYAAQKAAGALGRMAGGADDVTENLVNTGASSSGREANEVASVFQDLGIKTGSARDVAIGNNILSRAITDAKINLSNAPVDIGGRVAPEFANLQNRLFQLQLAQRALNMMSGVPDIAQAGPGLLSRVISRGAKTAGQAVPFAIGAGLYEGAKALKDFVTQGNGPSNFVRNSVRAGTTPNK